VGIPPATDFVWDYGDGVTETLGFVDPVSHVYAGMGTYTVVLSACNVAGCDDFTADVEVVGTAPVVSFTSNSPVALGNPVVFSNTSDPGAPEATDFVWDFGDGVTETLGFGDPVSHMYAAAGTYTVTLTACNAIGCDTASADVVVFIEQWHIFMPVVNRH
jgi:PKD repeat protein